MDVQWLKSSFSDQPEGNCLELASCDGGILMRESDDPSVVVKTTPAKLRAFLAGARAGEFDGVA
ncbi:DUF397 domain-containing protein [Streptomyces sp. NPDC057654]|uniref:DUF397 domain-containing protein n=1 Tax=Streptomyces sp. NPDC057654 TaxID=3346196 RepID=UPI0036AAD938